MMTEEPVAAGGCFTDSNRALAFLNALAGAGLAAKARYRRAPDAHWWIEAPVQWQAVAHLIWAAGGKPYCRQDEHWTALSPAGMAVADERLQPVHWPAVDLAVMLAATSLPPCALRSGNTLAVIAPGVLARWVLRRALALNVAVRVTPALQQPLATDNPASGTLMLTLSVQQGIVPRSLVRAIANLPYVLVAHSSDPEQDRLWVDIRCRSPLRAGLPEQSIPPGECWVLGAAEAGHWRLQLLGAAVDGTQLLQAPTASTPPQTIADADITLPAPIPVRLVADRQIPTRCDAVLLDDTELDWLRLFLIHCPVSEQLFLLPGPGHHLLLAPGGLTSIIPFGLPLSGCGPGGLYLEQGLRFHPPLPEAARQQAFGLTEGRIVAVTQNATYGFDSQRLTPVWTLWVGTPPPIQEGLSSGGARLLNNVAEAVRQAEVDQAEEKLPVTDRLRPRTRPGDRPQLLAEAQRAELAGNYIRAAELLEAAGELARAGRLYERAASLTDR